MIVNCRILKDTVENSWFNFKWRLCCSVYQARKRPFR